MRASGKSIVAILVSLIPFAITPRARATMIYYENFNLASSSTVGFPINGWQMHSGTTASIPPSNRGFDIDNSFSPGNATNLPSSNVANGTTPSMAAYIVGTSPINSAVLWTDELTFNNDTDFQINQFNWWQRNSPDTGTHFNHPAIRIDGQGWFTTDNAGFDIGQTGSGSNVWFQVQVDAQSSTWYPLNFVPGAQLNGYDSAQPMALPRGNISAFGLFIQRGSYSSGQTTRVDGFSINATAIPEPGMGGLLIWLGLGLRRSRAKSSS
jgi:hypothetical protein